MGRVYTTPKPTSPPTAKKWKSRRKRPSKRRGQRRRQSRHDDFWFYDLFDLGDYSDSSEESIMQEYQSTPVQNVYFFKKGKSAWKKLVKILPKTALYSSLTPFGLCVSFLFLISDKYYRVDLQTKRVDAAYPPYPRSIAKYWLGCKHEAAAPDASRAEKR